jgi:hypothetical protein
MIPVREPVSIAGVGTGRPEYRHERIRVSGVPGEFFIYRTPEGTGSRYHTGVYFPATAGTSRQGLRMEADCQTAGDCVAARRIFESVQFD